MLALLALIGLFAFLLQAAVAGNWRTCLFISIVIGFLQDPIRKLLPGQPGLMVGLSLIAFSLSAYCLWSSTAGRFSLSRVLKPAPRLFSIVQSYLLLVFLQFVNAVVQFGNILRATIGLGFYLSPLLGLWLGFVVGLDQRYLRIFLRVYICLSFFFASTVFLDYLGVDIPLFKEVGGGILIHVIPGFSVFGASGLWRSSELAAWHLSASTCIAFSLGVSLPQGQKPWPYFFYGIGAMLLTIVTARRKSLVQIFVFLGLYLFFADRSLSRISRGRVIGGILFLASVAFFLFYLAPADLLGADYAIYLSRSSSSVGSIDDRVNQLVVNALSRALEISNGIGLGVGTLAQTGDANVAAVSGSGFAFVSESGAGKILAELGFLVLILVPLLALEGFSYLRYCLSRLRFLVPQSQNLYVGLFSFALSNLFFFSAAAGVYGDPMVLVLCGICLGSVLAVPFFVPSSSSRLPAGGIG